jgi:hypothetical protein
VAIMRGFSEYRGIQFRIEFDEITQQFVQRQISPSPAKDENWLEGERVSPPISLAFSQKRPKRKFDTPARKTG